jgi:hypothetical protein
MRSRRVPRATIPCIYRKTRNYSDTNHRRTYADLVTIPLTHSRVTPDNYIRRALPYRSTDHCITVQVDKSEVPILHRLMVENKCHSLADLLRTAINSMLLESGDDALIERRPTRGRPRKAGA